ncbi:protein kinase family protein [Cytobacillus firmus]|uniref:protein kinase family protein n=1 Tax=Cytobacillus firmus TaxID=1399 RepID=UPI001C94C3CE|nr:protein kinase family protein [Cytobacillus firmus]MBY6052458.1 protein kinase family protein [Cytobacillus firmus]USK38335.1 protein kinase family protein [Cytobacillus firmus]
MKLYHQLADSVKFSRSLNWTRLLEKDDRLEFIGAGRSAFAFRIKETNLVLKVFFPEFKRIAREEAEIYRALPDNPYYPSLYGSGDNYIVIDYVQGLTLFDCLAQGVPINEETIGQIDEALKLARESGLNPSDIHLRNIILTEDGRIKIIDVARFKQTKNCTQWDDLKHAFYKFYRRRYFPKKIPVLIMNTIAALYKKRIVRLGS